MKRVAVLISLTVLILLSFHLVARADEIDEINKKIEDLSRVSNEIGRATETNEQTFAKLNQQLDSIKNQVTGLEKEIAKKEAEVKTGGEILLYQKTLLNERARSYYKNINKATLSLMSLLVTENLSVSLQNFFYEKSLADEDRQTIIKIVLYIKNLEEKKKNLEKERERLNAVKKKVDEQSIFLAGEITKAKKYLGELRSQIAALTARQQQLLAEKLASLNIPRSAATSLSGCIDDRNIDPGFSPSWAFFTYGVPNRVGLNQYGARGRADSGQNHETILRAYYNFDSLSDADTNIKIRVDGYGEHSLEDYVKRIYEMPADWNMEALKAQAIAARSYALSYTNNGSGSICATQYCQVFQANEKGGRWNEAVEATRGKIMTQGGQPIKAWYSSTHGGYVLSSSEIGWSGTSWTKHAIDTPSGNVGNLGDLQNNAYDRGSPWFYCDWGSRASYNKTAWLKTDEVTDIVNTILLARSDSSTREHLYQPDKPNPEGKETWDAQKVKEQLKAKGINPANQITDISVGTDLSSGKTTSILISSDAGGFTFDGAEFKNYFNLRAPANIQIVGPLFSVEKR